MKIFGSVAATCSTGLMSNNMQGLSLLCGSVVVTVKPGQRPVSWRYSETGAWELDGSSLRQKYSHNESEGEKKL